MRFFLVMFEITIPYLLWKRFDWLNIDLVIRDDLRWCLTKVLAEISTELNWHTSLIKLFVTEKVVWRLKCCRLKHVLVTLKYHYKHQIFCKWEVVAEVVVVVVFVNRKYLKGPSSNIGTLQTSFSIHRVLFPNKIILAKTALQRICCFSRVPRLNRAI